MPKTTPKATPDAQLAAARATLDRQHGRMCDSLFAFAAPYLSAPPSGLSIHETFALAVSAWNLPFVPYEQRERIVREARAEEVALLLEMYMRRVRGFGGDPRLILEHRLIELASGEYVPMVIWVSARPLTAGR